MNYSVRRPCGGCPFKKVSSCEGPNPGGSHPYVYVGQAHGPFWLPCHNSHNYDGKRSDMNTVAQCAGAAIFRANLGIADRMPNKLLKLEPSTDVFESVQEFADHYLGKQPKITQEDITNYLLKELKQIR